MDMETHLSMDDGRGSRAESAACPVCEPGRFDGALEQVPEMRICEKHADHPFAAVVDGEEKREVCRWLALEVVPLEFLRYHVKSKAGSGFYLVDLSEYHGHGKCGCPSFEFRMEPLVKERKAGQALNYDWMCDHLRAARWHFTNEVLLRLSLERRK
jgi:hypothetical protein